MKNFTIGFGLCWILAGGAGAAPLFPDVKDEHWAKDAVAKLAAQGLLEGYPDGTFKGDRAATRWEVAMMVARLLARMEQSQATFASRAELEEVRKLAFALKDELTALGVRVTSLEENVSRLDQRVSELERITFYGEIQSRVGLQSFHNTGSPAMSNALTGAQTIDYNQSVGSTLGAGGFLAAPSPGAGLPNNYFVTGIPGVTDWLHGRPLTNGATFTVRGLLGVNVKVSDEIDGGMELIAFTSQGNQVVDAFWGISAPYQNNVFTSTTSTGYGPAAAGLQPLNNAPFTRMVLDNFWVKHKPSGTKLIVGSFNHTDFDSMVYNMQPNPTVGGPTHLNSFGLQLTGQHLFGDDEQAPRLTYELMGTKLADGNVDLVTGGSNSYWSHAEGANVALHFEEGRGVGRLNWLHAANDASAGAAGTVGLIQLPNLVSNWVNPAGYYNTQLANTNLGGIGSTSDQRPVPMGASNDGSTGVPGTFNVGGIGPQDQTSYGLSLNYKWDTDYKPRVFGEYGHSNYRPQKNSPYSVGGNAFRAGVGASFLDDQLDVDLHYLRVDPTYDPFILQFPTIGGISTPMWRIPDLNQFWNLYSLHDTATLPHNRQGLRASLNWKFNPNGKLAFSYGNLQQVRSSMQDVRFSTNSLAPGTPNSNVLGYSPGFMDPVFLGYAPQTFAAAGGNALALPLEDHKGTMEHYMISASHKWKFDDAQPEGVTLSGLFLNYNYRRNSNLASLLPGPSGIRGESQNRVDFTIQGWNVGLGYDLTKDFALRAGFTQLNVFGHIDPLGVYSDYAASTGNTRFKTWDITQNIPEVGFDWALSEKSSWGLTAKFYSETDHIPSSVTASPTLPSLNVALSPQNAHPFSYSGIQLMSTYSLRF